MDKFAEMYGEEFVGAEVKEEYIKKLIRIEKEHIKKYGYRHTSIAQLRKETEGK